jgi:hypothetical protein
MGSENMAYSVLSQGLTVDSRWFPPFEVLTPRTNWGSESLSAARSTACSARGLPLVQREGSALLQREGSAFVQREGYQLVQR